MTLLHTSHWSKTLQKLQRNEETLYMVSFFFIINVSRNKQELLIKKSQSPMSCVHVN